MFSRWIVTNITSASVSTFLAFLAGIISWSVTVDYAICITCIMYQQLWGYKVEEKLYLGVREQKKVEYHWVRGH
jgi:hypothetical protein